MRNAPRRLKNFPAYVAALSAKLGGKPVEIWFADEARIGQKNKLTRRWARRGSRPAAPKDQRTASAYLFGAICPAEGKGSGACPAPLHDPGHDPAPERNRAGG